MTAEKSKMQEILANNPDFLKNVKVGDTLEGTVINKEKSAIYIDLGHLGTGIVYGRELKDGFGTSRGVKLGDKVSASVTELENERGYIELSFREANYEKAWTDLATKMENNETISVKIMAANKGGFMTQMNGLVAFLPVSQLATEHYPRVEGGDKNKILSKLNQFIGHNFDVKILDIDQDQEKLILSEKAVEAEKNPVSQSYNIGDVVEGTITGVTHFGAFIKFDNTEGLIHISELDWQLIENPKDIVKVGDKIKAQIIGIDNDRVSLSAKALKQDPWIEGAKKYKAGEKVKGLVTKVNFIGAFVKLDEHIHGLVHSTELAKLPEDAIKANKEYDFKILTIEPKEHKLGLGIVSEKDKKEAGGKKQAASEEKKEEKPAKPAAPDKTKSAKSKEAKKDKKTEAK